MRRTFAIATRDELWIRGRLTESRLGHGVALDTGSAIEADDARDPDLVRAVDEQMTRLRAMVPAEADRMRLVASARRVAGAVLAGSAITLGMGELSVVTTPEHFDVDRALVAGLAATAPSGGQVDYRGLPIVWRNGSAAVLLHEAIGHAAEQGHAPLRWPSWLSVRDEPTVELDDVGDAPGAADLLAGGMPQAWRRESFRDVPLRRMSRLVVRQSGAQLAEPARRIDVHLVAHGAYDTLSEELTLRVAAADLVDEAGVRRLPPFWLRESRAAVPQALIGASGPAMRYPGVVCSLEGQEVVVESFAPLMMTRFE